MVAVPDVDTDSGPAGDPESVAREICLRALTLSARTRSELADRLRKKGVSDVVAGRVLDRFAEVGLIDDAALASTFSRAAHEGRGLSRRAVVAKLRQRGVPDSTVEVAVSHIDSDSEHAAARALAVRKAASLRSFAPEVQARRLVGLLARRGYSPSVAYSVTKDVLSGAGLADDAAADLELADDGGTVSS